VPPASTDRAPGDPAAPTRRRIAVAAAVLAAVLAAVVAVVLVPRTPPVPVEPPAVASAPAAVAASAPAAPREPAAWVDDAGCASCHASAAQAWRRSHHAHAMAAPAAETVKGDFRGTRFRHRGVETRFSLRDGRYGVRTDGPDGRPADFEVAWTFGWSPLQQYLIAMPGGRLQALQVAWDEPRRRWYHLRADERAPPGDVLHWTGRYQNANTMCLSCHVTGWEKRYDAQADTFASTWRAPNVGCQACHGPGGRHVDWARAKTEGRPPPATPGERFGLVVDFAAAGPRGQVEACSACHSRRTELTASAPPGAPRLDHFLPMLLSPPAYHVDGQQREEVFVDGSYRQTRMYQAGVTCTHCHDAHDGRTTLQGDALCTQCHAPTPNPAFPKAAGRFDARSHHFHREGSEGARCVSCHMPSTTYMGIQARPDHSIRVPRPDVSAKLGTPDACTQCHTDRDARWAAERVAQWYGRQRRQEPHWGEAFAAARAGRPGAADAVARIAADRAQPAIVRATALDLLRADPRTGDAIRVEATRDPDPEVRAAAADSLEPLPPVARASGLAPLLSDPVRAVRIAAARAFASLPRERVDPAVRPALDLALDEYVTAQSVSLDMPGARLNLAVLAQHRGRSDEAASHYLAALRLDPDFTPARANLARLYNALGRNADAERVLREGLSRQPGIGELQYSLGLLLAEEERFGDAVAALARAAALMPERAKVRYNLGLAQQRAGRRREAEASLLAAQRLDPADAQTPYALAVLYAQDGRWDDARRWADALVALAPADPAARQLAARVRERR
jgi:tetratricopeptide (TPR) repeat protein